MARHAKFRWCLSRDAKCGRKIINQINHEMEIRSGYWAGAANDNSEIPQEWSWLIPIRVDSQSSFKTRTSLNPHVTSVHPKAVPNPFFTLPFVVHPDLVVFRLAMLWKDVTKDVRSSLWKTATTLPFGECVINLAYCAACRTAKKDKKILWRPANLAINIGPTLTVMSLPSPPL